MFNEVAEMSQVSIKYLNLCLEDKTQYRKKNGMDWHQRDSWHTQSLSFNHNPFIIL